MANIYSNLNQPKIFDTFFGAITLVPGSNPEISDKAWKSMKTSNSDVMSLLESGALVEQPQAESAAD